MARSQNMARSIVSLVASLVLVVGLCPIPAVGMADDAWAADVPLAIGTMGDESIVASGTYSGYAYTSSGDYSGRSDYLKPKYSWTLYDDGCLLVDLSDNAASSASTPPGWMSYANLITEVEMTASYGSYNSWYSSSSGGYYYYSTITGDMFSNLPNLTTVNAPYAKMVGPNTFSGCPKLQDVTIGTGYRYSWYTNTASQNSLYIFDSAFAGCDNLSRVTIGGQYTNGVYISDSAFKDCGSLSKVTITSTAGTLGLEAFSGCTSLRTIDIPAFASIGNSAFAGCTRLRSVGLIASTSNETFLGNAAFKGCPALESIALPSGMTTLYASTFEGDSSLASASLPASITSIGASAFKDCSALASIDLPKKLITIGQRAFAGSGITSATVPSGVAALNQSAFEGCPDLKTVTISSGTTSLGASSFANCGSLEEVVVGEDVLTVSAGAFANDAKLSEVRFKGEAPTIASDAFAGVTAAALYPIDNVYWAEDDLLDYGGSLSWSPYGDLSVCTLVAEDLVYAGIAQQPITHLITPNGLDVSSAYYIVASYSDAGCTTPIDADGLKNPGAYYVTVTGISELGCTGTVGPVAFEIGKAPLEVSYVSEAVDTGETPAYRIAYTGFVADEDESVLTSAATLATPSTLASGHNYTLTPEGAAAENYTITYVSGMLSVNPVRIAMPACATGLVYTGADQVAVTSGTGYVLSGTTYAVNAGDYVATIELEDGYAWADGSLEPLTYTWSIGKAQLTAAFVDETIAAGATPALNVAVTGFLNGETAGSAAGYAAPSASVSSQLKPGYSYTATVAGGAADNYTFAYESGKVTVLKAVIDPPAATLSLDYDGTQKTAVPAGEGYTLSGTPTATDAGTYSVNATLKDGYEWSDGTTAVKKFSWTVSPASGALALDANTVSLKIAEAASVGLSYTGDGSVAAISSDTSVATAQIQAGKVKVEAVGEGTARITVSSSACSNYTTPASVTLTVAVQSVDLQECIVAAAGGVYTGKPFNAHVMVTQPGGLELAEASSHAIHYYSDSTCTQEVAASELVASGTYWARAEALAGGRSSGHTNAAQFTIAKAQLTATYEGEAVAYGAVPKAAVKVTGFVGDDDASNASGYAAPTVQLPSTLARNTSYDLVPQGGTAGNYEFSYVGGTLAVGKMPVERPAAAAGLAYTGSAQVGVPAGEGYTLSGTAGATSVGAYSATAVLDDGCMWNDGSAHDVVLDWEISAADIAQAECAEIPEHAYTGADAAPSPQLLLGSLPLVLGKDYTLQYANNRNAGIASVIASGIGNFTGSKSMTFAIAAIELDASCVGGIEASYSYTGRSVTPDPTVICDGSTLVKGSDYTVSYANNLSAGTATVTVAGKGNYKGSAAIDFSIVKTSLADAVVTGIVDKIYTGEAVTQQATLTLDGTPLEEGKDYTVSYSDNTDVGTASLTFTGREGFSGSKTVHFFISPASISQATIAGVEPSYTYTGASIAPMPTVTLDGKNLVEDVDYRVSYASNREAGVATVLVSGVGNYTGSVTATFAIAKAVYDLSGVTLSSQTVAYDGKPHSLAIAGSLPAGITVSYSGNGETSAGSHTVTATFAGDENYEPVASMSAVLTIEKAVVEMPSAVSGLIYNGATQEGVRANGPYALAGATGINAGAYTATAALDDPANYQWADGSSGDQQISWSIAKAKLTAAYVGEAIEYGETPVMAVEVSGFVSGEAETTAAGYTAPSVQVSAPDAGTYRLVPAGGKAANYEFAYVAGTLSIGKVPVIVRLQPAFKTFGENDPEFAYEVLGASWSAIAPLVTTSRAGGEDVGAYDVAVSVAESPNYRIAVAGSMLTIAPARVSALAISESSFAYNGKVQKAGVTSVEAGSLALGRADYAVAYSSASPIEAGTYAVTVTGKGNYAGSKSATFKIEQASNKAMAAKMSIKKALKLKALKKKARAIALPKVTTKFGTAVWKVKAKDKKKVLTLKSGKIQVKKGAKKGTYTIKVIAQVAKTKNYKAASTKAVTVKVVVK